MFQQKIPENRRKSQKSTFREFFWAMSWISFEIRQSHLKFDGDLESVSIFYHSSIVEELSIYFRCISGKFLFSNCRKVKSELCSPEFTSI